MPNSIRAQIMSAITVALEGINPLSGYVSSSYSLVTESLPESLAAIDLQDLPAAFPIDGDEMRADAEIGDTETNMVSDLQVIITSVIFNKNNTTRQARTDKIRDVEKAILNSATLAALATMVVPGKVTTDKGTIPNYSMWDQEFHCTYYYDSEDGG